MDVLGEAISIAKKDLRDCYGQDGILAGTHQFSDYWARDGFFASLGSLKLKDFDIAKKNLSLFLSHAKKGQLPLRMGKSSAGIVFSYIFPGVIKDRHPVYPIDKSSGFPVDQNSLFVIAFHEYAKAARDKLFLVENMMKAEEILQWNFKNDRDKDLLIEEKEYCNWADSIKKRGKVLYTNICHCHALMCMSELYHVLGNKTKSEKYKHMHEKVKKKINEIFWNGEHYIDFIYGEKHYNFFSTDGNILAIIWKIADRERAKHIEEASHIFDVNEIPSQCVHPDYPSRMVSPQLKLLGLGDYHNGLSWIWLGSLNALAKYRLGMKKEAIEILERISSLIIEYRGVYEVYEKTGVPVNRLIYKAEQPFAWSAGLFIYAASEIKKDLF
jgi:glycogen debranching enzyme